MNFKFLKINVCITYMFKFVDGFVWVNSINSIFHKTQFMSDTFFRPIT